MKGLVFSLLYKAILVIIIAFIVISIIIYVGRFAIHEIAKAPEKIVNAIAKLIRL